MSYDSIRLIESTRSDLSTDFYVVSYLSASPNIYGLLGGIDGYWYTSDGPPIFSGTTYTETSSVRANKAFNTNDQFNANPYTISVTFLNTNEFSIPTLYFITTGTPSLSASDVLQPWRYRLEPFDINSNGISAEFLLFDDDDQIQSIVSYYSAFDPTDGADGNPAIYFNYAPSGVTWPNYYFDLVSNDDQQTLMWDNTTLYQELSVDGVAVEFNSFYSSTPPLNFILESYIDDGLQIVRTQPFISFTWPYDYNIYNASILSSSSKRYWITFQTGGEFPPSTTLKCKWRVTPTDGVTIDGIGRGRLYNQRFGYTFDEDGWTDADTLDKLGMMELEAVDFSETYSVVLSTNFSLQEYNNVVGQYYDDTLDFRPYQNLQDGDNLYVKVTPLVFASTPRIYRIETLGRRSGLASTSYYTTACVPPINKENQEEIEDEIFNLNPNQLLLIRAAWPEDNTLTITNAVGSPYTFSDIAEAAGSASRLDFNIITDEVEVNPSLNSYSVTAYAVSSGEVPNCSVIARGIADFSVMDWVSDSVYSPEFAINYEDTDTTDIYRLTSNNVFYNISCFDRTRYPAESQGSVYFNVVGQDIAYTVSLGGNATLTVPASIADTHTITMSALLTNPSWPASQAKTAVDKRVHLVSYFPPASFAVFPEYYWDSSSKSFVVNTDTNPVVSSFANCHTENFVLCSYTPAPTTVWIMGDVYNLDDKIIVTDSDSNFTFNENSDYIKKQIQTRPETTFHNVTVGLFNSELPIDMNLYYYDDQTGAQTIYENFSVTNSSLSSSPDPLQFYNLGSQGITLISANKVSIAAPKESITFNGSGVFFDTVPVIWDNDSFNSFNWNISTRNWTKQSSVFSTEFIYKPKVDNLVAIDYVPNFYPFKIDFILTTVATPSASDFYEGWCVNNILLQDSVAYQVTSYPIVPSIYTPNFFALTGEDVAYENVLPEYEGLSAVWTDNSVSVEYGESMSPYITNYNSAGIQDVTLTTIYDDSTYSIECTSVEILNRFTAHDRNYERVYGSTPLILPYNRQLSLMPPNEWSTYKTFNGMIDRLEENLTYLDNMSKIYDAPPTRYVGWLGTTLDVNSQYTYWHVNLPGVDYVYDSPLYATNGRFTNITDIYVAGNNEYFPSNTMVIAESTKMHLISSDYLATPISERNYRTIGDNFANLVSIDVDSNGRIYTLDKVKNRIVVFRYSFAIDRWIVLYDWGGLGGVKATNKFNRPNKLALDRFNNVWVADTGNKCIKKYSSEGGWRLTITHSLMNKSEPISVAIDSTGVIHVLTQDKVIKFNSETGEYIDSYTFFNPNNDPARDIIASQDDGFMYVLLSTRVVKILEDGTFAGDFADTLDLDYNYNSIMHDKHRNLYITNVNHILKYVDRLIIRDLKLNVDYHAWPVSAIYVNKEEYNQSWILNKSFQRMWDNLEVFRRSIIAKPSAVLDDDGNTRLIVSNHSPDEYHEFEYDKSQVYIAVNELVTSNVVNRCAGQLFDAINYLRELLSEGRVQIDTEFSIRPSKKIICEDIDVVLTLGQSYDFYIDDLDCHPDYTVDVNDIFNTKPNLGVVSLNTNSNGDYYIRYSPTPLEGGGYKSGSDSFRINYKRNNASIVLYRAINLILLPIV
jgi:hypothetical protein